jgi:hypothetical protein
MTKQKLLPSLRLCPKRKEKEMHRAESPVRHGKKACLPVGQL